MPTIAATTPVWLAINWVSIRPQFGSTLTVSKQREFARVIITIITTIIIITTMIIILSKPGLLVPSLPGQLPAQLDKVHHQSLSFFMLAAKLAQLAVRY